MSTRRNVAIYLDDILESIERIQKNTENISKKEFLNDLDKQDVVAYRLEIIGEAVKNIPDDFRSKFPDVPWQDIAKTRDKIIHHYYEVDPKQIWVIIQNDIGPLKTYVKKMLEEFS